MHDKDLGSYTKLQIWIGQSGATINLLFETDKEAERAQRSIEDAQQSLSMKDELLPAPPVHVSCLQGEVTIQPASVVGVLRAKMSDQRENSIAITRYEVETQKLAQQQEPVGFV